VKQTVLVFGGLGDPNSSVVTLYKGVLQELGKSYRLIAIDPKANQLSSERQDESQVVKFDGCYSDLSAFESKTEKAVVRAVFVLTPVSTHLDIIESVAKRYCINELLFVVEKPSFALNEIDRGFYDVIPHYQSLGAQFYFIETALVSPSMEYFFAHYSKTAMKLPNEIVVVAADNPMQIADSMKQYRFDKKRESLNARNLLDSSKNGGGGFGFDMGIHGVAGLYRYLQKADLLDAVINIVEARGECLEDPQLKRSPGSETYLHALARIVDSHSNHSIDVAIEAGKAGEVWDRRIELYYDDTIVVISFGTLGCPPYLWIEEAGHAQLKTFDVADAGYPMHFNDILFALGYERPQTLSQTDSEVLMCMSMSLLLSVFERVGKDQHQRERNLYKVSKHETHFLTQLQLETRMKLEELKERKLYSN
jgi:predicted dehydrogenase